MASWNEILDKFGQMPSPYDAVRREYISRLSTYTGRNTICIILLGCKSLSWLMVVLTLALMTMIRLDS